MLWPPPCPVLYVWHLGGRALWRWGIWEQSKVGYTINFLNSGANVSRSFLRPTPFLHDIVSPFKGRKQRKEAFEPLHHLAVLAFCDAKDFDEDRGSSADAGATATCKPPAKIRHTRPSSCFGHHPLDLNFGSGPLSYSGTYFQRGLAAQRCRPSRPGAQLQTLSGLLQVFRTDLPLGATATTEPHQEAPVIKHYTTTTSPISKGWHCYHSSWARFT